MNVNRTKYLCRMLLGFFSTFFFFLFTPVCFSFFIAAPADGRWIWAGNYLEGGGTTFANHARPHCRIDLISAALSEFSSITLTLLFFFYHHLEWYRQISHNYILESVYFLICGLSTVFHVLSSHPFPCGRTLLSHLSSLINPLRPQITAPLRLVQRTMLD